VHERATVGTYLYVMSTFYKFLTFSSFKTLYEVKMTHPEIKEKAIELTEKKQGVGQSLRQRE